MSEPRLGLLRKVQASICHHCPICKYGRKHPESLAGRVLRHPLHADHCPLWKAEQEVYGEAQKPGLS